MAKQERMPAYGGQAVIEGVMMRGKKFVAMAVRAPGGEIVIEESELKGIYRSKIAKWPFFRGLVSLWDSLGLGLTYLTRSANIQTGGEEKIEGVGFYLTIAVSMLIGIGLFFLAPAALAGWLEKLLSLSSFLSNLLEGLIRLLILVVYLVLIGQMPDIKRTFAYHGAEHKTINGYESNTSMDPAAISQMSREHPRCGTSFILTLVFVSVIIFTLFGPLPLATRLLTRLLMIPVLAGISYEYIRWTARHIDSKFIRFIMKPNLLLQRLTTREPDTQMLEVSIAAFKRMVELENPIQS